jgi:valyl-tRNA synthetase
LWNATRFALLNGATVAGELPAPAALGTADRWILSRLAVVTAEVDDLYERFEFAKLSDLLYHFAWDEVCDWYLELAKVSLARGGAEADCTRRVLGHVLDVLLRLLHPVTPFVTESLWTALTGADTVVTAAWPTSDPAHADAEAEAEIGELARLVTEVRRFRADQGLTPGQRVPAVLVGLGDSPLAGHEDEIRALTRLKLADGGGFQSTASLPVGEVTVELDLSGAIDVAAERRRLEKDDAVAEKERAQAAGKLGNEQFLAKAPAAVVEKVRGQLADSEADLLRLRAQLDRLPA